MNMKDHATVQAILQSTGHPLEPIVAMELKKMYNSDKDLIPTPVAVIKMQSLTQLYLHTEVWDVDWYNNYE
jgi:hypothetical protein